MYNGVSSSFAPVSLQETYAVSDVVAVIVYNGHVFNTPHLALSGEDPNYKITHPSTDTITSNVLTYSIHLEAQNGFQSSPAGLNVDVEGLDGFAQWEFKPTSTPVLGRNGINDRWLTLYVTPTTTMVGTTTHVITGTRAFYVSAIDDNTAGTGIRRYWVGVASIGDTVNSVQRDKPAVTCYPTNSDQNFPFVATVAGQQAKYELQLDVWGVATTQDATVAFTSTLPMGFEWVSTPPWTRATDPTKHPGAKLQVNLKANDDAIANTPHTISLQVSAPGIESQSCNLYVLVEDAGSTVKDYVEILGYAAVEITGYYNNKNPVNPEQNANAVRGRVVSELMSSPPDLTYGLRARLIPWNQ